MDQLEWWHIVLVAPVAVALLLAAGIVIGASEVLAKVFGRYIVALPSALWATVKDWSLTAISPAVVMGVAFKRWCHRQITRWLFRRDDGLDAITGALVLAAAVAFALLMWRL